MAKVVAFGMVSRIHCFRLKTAPDYCIYLYILISIDIK